MVVSGSEGRGEEKGERWLGGKKIRNLNLSFEFKLYNGII